MKGPFEIVIFNDFFIREKPATVIELGSYSGGCALWMADTLKCFGVKSHVYSVDYNFDNLDDLAKSSPDITFIKGDLKNIENVFPEKMLKVCTTAIFNNIGSPSQVLPPRKCHILGLSPRTAM